MQKEKKKIPFTFVPAASSKNFCFFRRFSYFFPSNAMIFEAELQKAVKKKLEANSVDPTVLLKNEMNPGNKVIKRCGTDDNSANKNDRIMVGVSEKSSKLGFSEFFVAG